MSRSPAISLARFFSAALIFVLLCGISSAQDPKAKAPPTTKPTAKAKSPVYASPEEAEKDPDFKFQGEYFGEITIDGKRVKLGAQVIARGNGKFHAVLYHGGLPGDGWKRGDKKEEADLRRNPPIEIAIQGKEPIQEEIAKEIKKAQEKMKDVKPTGFKFEKYFGSFAGPVTRPGEEVKNPENLPVMFTIGDGEKYVYGQLDHVKRTSPTLGLKPAKDAIVLFDGYSTDAFQDGTKMTDDKLLMPEAITKQKFQSFTLHAEFRTPFQPEDGNTPKLAQHRGNSGIYLQNRYEIQILDSFGLEPANDYCGGFYKFHTPLLNMCFPPLSWQTYDVDFTAAHYDGNKKVKNARLTAKLNGVVIHDDIELTQETAGSLLKEGPEPGGLLFQQHSNPVRFKNIWLVEKK